MKAKIKYLLTNKITRSFDMVLLGEINNSNLYRFKNIEHVLCVTF